MTEHENDKTPQPIGRSFAKSSHRLMAAIGSTLSRDTVEQLACQALRKEQKRVVKLIKATGDDSKSSALRSKIVRRFKQQALRIMQMHHMFILTTPARQECNSKLVEILQSLTTKGCDVMTMSNHSDLLPAHVRYSAPHVVPTSCTIGNLCPIEDLMSYKKAEPKDNKSKQDQSVVNST
jgi:hypothetical protein